MSKITSLGLVFDLTPAQHEQIQPMLDVNGTFINGENAQSKTLATAFLACNAPPCVPALSDFGLTGLALSLCLGGACLIRKPRKMSEREDDHQ